MLSGGTMKELYGRATGRVRGARSRNSQGPGPISELGTPVRRRHDPARWPAAAKADGISGPNHRSLTFSLDNDRIDTWTPAEGAQCGTPGRPGRSSLNRYCGTSRIPYGWPMTRCGSGAKARIPRPAAPTVESTVGRVLAPAPPTVGPSFVRGHDLF